MPKLKTHKGTAKRIKQTASGKLLRAHAFKNHNLTKKAADRKRSYAKNYSVTGKAKATLKRMLGE